MKTTTTTTLFSLTEVPRGPDGQPLRRSERLRITESKHELYKELQQENGVRYERRVLYNTQKKKFFKLYAVRALNVKLDNLWPGRIVKAIDCYPQVDTKADPYDGTIGRSSVAGPIAAKFRMNKYVSVSTKPDWRGDTPWAGMPILAKFNKAYSCEDKCYADLSRPHWISQWEHVYDDVGHIKGGEYSRLIDLLTMKEREFRTAAFAKFDTDDNQPEEWVPWDPDSEHQPKSGVRYADKKSERMSKKTFQRV
ncbi:unnamed protein product [Aureobasidium mustum]|uniref:Uncharacterized protein n=1 Tax=Aureobasidium mustum TaxID=2773714 RepID=A0A9N8PHM0_9PEZI|nr:unnamed protein product [Aureobasidium mustum]